MTRSSWWSLWPTAVLIGLTAVVIAIASTNLPLAVTVTGTAAVFALVALIATSRTLNPSERSDSRRTSVTPIEIGLMVQAAFCGIVVLAGFVAFLGGACLVILPY